jgi:asparagine synthase (glutamine-hydrolysing)
MCGICGLLAPAAGPPPSVETVERMAAALVHRGPDHGAARPLGQAVLGYRRLSVVDLAETGLQPVASEDGSVHAVLNGEIYNFPELRRELADAGHEVPGRGDTQVLPHLYEEHGPRFVDRLHGMFALALWDSRSERLLLARDRLGKKPLVWTRLPDGTLAFASEVKALAGLPGFARDVDLSALDAYLALGYVPPDRSAFGAVRRLPPGHLLVVDRDGERLERYWAPAAARDELTEEEWLEATRAELAAAVRRRLVADVPLGALLSGGIDSSVVVALMAEAASGPVRTFTIGFGESRYDERSYARAVAERFGTEHLDVVVEPDAASVLPRLAWAFDEPFADSSALPTFVVCELARREITVALTGDGGDEAFAGYERYVAHRAASRLPHAPAAALARLLRAIPAGRREPRSPFFRAARLLELAGRPADRRYGRLMEVFPAPLRESLWTPDALAELGEPRDTGALLGPPPAPGTLGLQLLDLGSYLPGDLLVKADLASMASSLELRSPFLDHRVVELGLSLPQSLKTRGVTGKVAVRRAFARDLPPGIAGRRKRGFGVPVSRWFRGDLAELARDLLLDERARGRGLFRPETVERVLGEHTSGRADHGARLWSLVMLELWQRFYVESERPPAGADDALVTAPAR